METFLDTNRTCSTLDKVLGLYTYDILGPLATPFVKGVWANADLRAVVTGTTTVIHPACISKEDIWNHLRCRVPIHIGDRYRWTSLHCDSIVQTTKYLESRLESVKSATCRYGILGYTPVAGHNQLTEAFCLHVWGVNLEHSDTTDAKYVFATDQVVDVLVKYTELLTQIFDIVRQGVRAAYDRSDKDRLIVRIPGIGLGQWSTMLCTYGIYDNVYLMFGKMLSDLAAALGPKFVVLHVAYKKGTTYFPTGRGVGPSRHFTRPFRRFASWVV